MDVKFLIYAHAHGGKNNTGIMEVVQKPKLGNYPVALIPGMKKVFIFLVIVSPKM